MTDSLTTLMPI